MPRWSVAGQAALPLSTAGLPAGSARVHVGPPFAASAMSRGARPLRSPGPANPQLVPESKLWPSEVIAPEQPPSTIVSRAVTGPTIAPPVLAVFPATVTLVSDVVPFDVRTPPPKR